MKILRILILLFSLTCCRNASENIIMTVSGPVPAEDAGISLTHEHILVDFIGADSIHSGRWNRQEVIDRALPFLNEAKQLGCRTFFECTPAYIGRDPLLLKSLADASGLNIITNTGYYGAADNKYIPQHAYKETAEQLAQRWTAEWEKGIDGTGIRPGFIKIGVAGGPLSELHTKLITAAALAHLRTGLAIASHTGPSVPAFMQIDVLERNGVSPEAFIWVHAQSEKDLSRHVEAAAKGAWISLDGVNENNAEEYIIMLKNMKDHGLLGKVLLSHDAGWYQPGEKDGGKYRGYNTLFEKLVPTMKSEGFTQDEIEMLLVRNPAKAFCVRVRRKN